MHEISMEVLIVDNGSRENLEVFLERNITKLTYQVIRADTHIKNRSYVRNCGIRAASGEVLLFLDSDIILFPESVYQHYQKVVNSNKVSIGYLYFPEFDMDPWSLEEKEVADNQEVGRDRKEFCFAPPYCEGWKHAWTYGIGGNTAIDKDFFYEVGLFDEKFAAWGYEDTELFYRLNELGANVCFNRGASGIHFPHIWNLANRKDAQITKNLFLNLHPTVEVELVVSNQKRRLLYWDEFIEKHRKESAAEAIPLMFESDLTIGDTREAVNPAKMTVSLFDPKADYPLLGFHIPVENGSAEKALLLPSWRWFGRGDIALLIQEVERVAKQVYVACYKEGKAKAKAGEWAGTKTDMGNLLVEHYDLVLEQEGTDVDIYRIVPAAL